MLLDQVREKARVKHFSIRTERCYVYWTQRYLRFLKGAGAWRHPAEAGTAEVEQLGHNDLRNTMIYPHVMEKAASRVRSPLDALA